MTNLDCLDFFAESFRTAWRIEGDVGRYLRRFYTVQMLLGRLFPSPAATTAVAFVNRLSKGRLRAFTALFYPTRPERMPAGLFEFQNFRHPVTGQTIDSTLDQLWNEARELGTRLLIDGREYPRRRSSRIPRCRAARPQPEHRLVRNPIGPRRPFRHLSGRTDVGLSRPSRRNSPLTPELTSPR